MTSTAGEVSSRYTPKKAANPTSQISTPERHPCKLHHKVMFSSLLQSLIAKNCLPFLCCFFLFFFFLSLEAEIAPAKLSTLQSNLRNQRILLGSVSLSF